MEHTQTLVEQIDIWDDMLRHMRTTMILDKDLMADVKRLAARRGTTMTAVVDQALRDYLRREAELDDEPEEPPFYFQGFHGGGLRPGVDPAVLMSNAAMQAFLDEFDPDFTIRSIRASQRGRHADS